MPRNAYWDNSRREREHSATYNMNFTFASSSSSSTNSSVCDRVLESNVQYLVNHRRCLEWRLHVIQSFPRVQECHTMYWLPAVWQMCKHGHLHTVNRNRLCTSGDHSYQTSWYTPTPCPDSGRETAAVVESILLQQIILQCIYTNLWDVSQHNTHTYHVYGSMSLMPSRHLLSSQVAPE